MELIDEIKKPFNIIMMILAISSVTFTTVFYVLSKKERKPVYYEFDPIMIFDSRKISPSIFLVDKDGKHIDQDVYVKDIIIWNAGDLPINPEHVRDPIKLVLTECNNLLDFRIAKESHPKISKFEVVKDPITSSENNIEVLKLSWQYFDPRFAVKIRLTYAGNKNIKTAIDGNILNVSKIDSKSDEAERVKNLNKVNLILYTLVVFLLGIVYVLRRKEIGKLKGVIITLLVTFMIILLFLVYAYFFYDITIPLYP